MSKIAFTAGRVSAFKCPADKTQAFLWDSTVPGLGLRSTSAGKPAYVFQGEYKGKTVRLTIGSPLAWSIPKAQEKSRELQRLIDQGRDPRIVKAENIAADVAKREVERRDTSSVGEAWARYLDEGKPKRRDSWKPRYLNDLKLMTVPGGQQRKRGKGLTRQGPIFPLLAMKLADVNEDALARWYRQEEVSGKHQAARALMMFRGFLRWASGREEYRAYVNRAAGSAAAIVELLPQVKRRTDCLEKAQLPGWLAGTDQLENRTIATYLRALLLTGARREEMASLKWSDVDFEWQKLTLADKVEATKTIPLSPYLAQQFAALPRINDFVFASRAKCGHLTEPRDGLAKVLKVAGIGHMTIHGLRRSFSLFGEAAGAPSGAIAQIMGHKPGSVAEGYRPRSIDVLRPILAKIEGHILKQVGVEIATDAGEDL